MMNCAITVKIANFLTQVPMSERQSRVQWRESVQHADSYSTFHVQWQECCDCRWFGRHADSMGCYWWLDKTKVSEQMTIVVYKKHVEVTEGIQQCELNTRVLNAFSSMILHDLWWQLISNPVSRSHTSSVTLNATVKIVKEKP